MIGEYSPDNDIVHFVVGVNYPISGVHYSSGILQRKVGINLQDVACCFSNDFKFTFNGAPKEFVFLVVMKVAVFAKEIVNRFY